MVGNIIRALRLPFITASILPFVFGSLVERSHFNLIGFTLGFIAVAATHLSANLINDYADAKSGADWQDKRFYKFFGGSKLIQEKVLSEGFYFSAALVCAIISLFSVILLALLLKDTGVVALYTIIVVLGWSYSIRPLQLSYRRIGEIIIFLLFGPAVVMGGYFIQTHIFPDMKSFILSLPFGFLTTAILFANEIPDYPDDVKARKMTWVSLSGPNKAFIIYVILISCAFISVALNLRAGYLNSIALFSFGGIFLAAKAARVMARYPADKTRLLESSQLTIALQALVGIILILGII